MKAWEKAKKAGLKYLESQLGVDVTKGFSSAFRKEAFTKEQIAKGLKAIAIETIQSAVNEFGKMLPGEIPWLLKTLGFTALKCSPTCLGSVATSIGTLGVGSPSLGACAMQIVMTLTPEILRKVGELAIRVSIIEAPKVFARFVSHFCPLRGSLGQKICSKGANLALMAAKFATGPKAAAKTTFRQSCENYKTKMVTKLKSVTVTFAYQKGQQLAKEQAAKMINAGVQRAKTEATNYAKKQATKMVNAGVQRAKTAATNYAKKYAAKMVNAGVRKRRLANKKRQKLIRMKIAKEKARRRLWYLKKH
jgi:hypothetical protein